MPGAQMLIVIFDEARSKTLRLLEQTPDEWLLWAPPGTQNHICWHGGHILWVADVLITVPITSKSELPAGWEMTFGQHGLPPSQTRDWPAKSELIARLAEQQKRIRSLLGGLSDERLAAAPGGGAPVKGNSLARWIAHGIHDEANHQGEMYLLMKLQRAFNS
jgi:hypothetical protein